jgi:mono/diheme cytochrome c family protein
MSYLSTLPRATASRAAWKMGEGVADRGSNIYARQCAGCHGASGEGKLGPALGNPAFVNAASTSYLAATIMRGRSGTPMPSWARDNVNYPRLTAIEALDLAEYIRRGLAASNRK